jgi:uncharacterized lipoprotein YddW (UPF0748 family)
MTLRERCRIDVPVRTRAALAGFTFLACLAWLGLAAPGGAEPPEPPPVPAAAAQEPLPPSPPAAAPPRPRRGLWVLCEGSQRVLEHAERLPLLLEDARALGVTDLFVQVYRGGRAWFDSSLADAAPYAATWRVPGPGATRRDALSVLIAEARARGLRVHAWVNVLSLADHRGAPLLAALGPGAAMVDQHGRSVLDYPGFEVPEPDRRWYRMGTPQLWVDPAAPGVAERIVATFAELVGRYPELDGLHLDYIRYPDTLPFSPGTRFGVGLSFGHGEASRARFRAETGLEAPFGASLANGDRFDDWRRGQVGGLVLRIRDAARASRPGLELSAAVWGDPSRAYLSIFQDWRGWLSDGLLDFAVPMLYSRDDRWLGQSVEALAGLADAGRIWVGLGAWLFAAEPGRAVAQLEGVVARGRLGTSLFSWDSIRDEEPLRAALAAAASEAAGLARRPGPP